MDLAPFLGQRVLVVGGAGFVGSNLVRQLLDAGPEEIVVVDNFLSSEPDNLPTHAKLRVENGSITDERILASLPDDFSYVFHLATYHGNQSSIANPLADHENNTLTSLKLFDKLKDFRRLKKVVYSSAGCTVAEKTYGEAHATDEDAPVSLWHDSPYQISKIVGELYANYYFSRYALPVVKVRFQNVYGPGEVLGAGAWRGTPATVWRNVTPTFVYRALKRMPLTIENDGVATRDFIFVDDVVLGLVRAATLGAAGEVYNIASGVETSVLMLATLINELTGSTIALERLPPRAWDRSGHRFGSTAKAKTKLGFEAAVSLRDGITRTIAWTRESMARIERCIAKHQHHLDLKGA